MVSSDTVVGIVGAVILTGAMIAVFYYENTNADDGPDAIGEGDNVYTFTYQTARVDVENATQGQTLSPSGSQRWTFSLPAYVYSVHATITWTETQENPALPQQAKSGPDTFRLELLNETGQAPTDATPQSGPDGELMIHHGHGPADVAPPQETVTVRGDTPEAAQAALANATASAHGVGDWEVVVTLVNVGSTATATQTDTGNDYMITITYQYWQPVLEE